MKMNELFVTAYAQEWIPEHFRSRKINCVIENIEDKINLFINMLYVDKVFDQIAGHE